MHLIGFNGREARAIKIYDIVLTRELHTIRADQLHYFSL